MLKFESINYGRDIEHAKMKNKRNHSYRDSASSPNDVNSWKVYIKGINIAIMTRNT